MRPIASLRSAVKAAARSVGLEVKRLGTPSECDKLFPHWAASVRQAGAVRTVFDVGANHGQSIVELRAEFAGAKFFAFEPSPGAAVAFRQAIGPAEDVELIEAAVGERDGLATLHENAEDVTNSLLVSSREAPEFAEAHGMSAVRTREVPLVRLDTFCSRRGIDCIDVLKIDSQGYERQILQGAGELLTPRVVRAVFLEVLFVSLYDRQSWCGEVIDALHGRGYRLFGFSNVAFDRDNGWKWADAMFVPASG